MSEEVGHTIKVLKGGAWTEYRDVMGHQVGYGSVQILFTDGNQVIINNYDEVRVILDDSQKEAFQARVTQTKMMKAAQAELQAGEGDNTSE